MSVDREALCADLLVHLRSTGHLVGLAKRPDGGGGDPDGAFSPYAVLWPQPTLYLPQLSSSHAGDRTVTQLTCVATDPATALRVADDMTALMLAPPATLAGRDVVQVVIEMSRGPDRDPQDERLFYAQVLPAVHTHA